MKPVGPQLRRALEALADLYRTDRQLADTLHRAVGASLQHMTYTAPELGAGALAGIEWPSETKTNTREDS